MASGGAPAWSARLVERELAGFGLAPRARCAVLPAEAALVAALLADPAAPPAIARGAGCAYGDAALATGGVVLAVPPAAEIRIDTARRRLRAGAGATIGAANRAALACGLFLPVLPGTAAVTLGGAVAADIHGKNHHRDGSIGRHLHALALRTADGARRELSAAREPELLALTAGAMGLTGLIEEVELELHPVASAWIRAEERATRDLDETIDLLLAAEERSQYVVSWLDALAPDDRLGRGFVAAGEHAERAELPAAARARPFEVPEADPWRFPAAGEGCLRQSAVRAANALRWRIARRAGRGAGSRDGARIVAWHRFFFPLDRVAGWNRAYGRRGFRQHQCVLPHAEARDGIAAILRALRAAGHPPFLAVLKGLGPGRGGLSFPRPGLTIALDLPRRPGLDEALDRVDEEVAARGGRIYLAKDAGARADRFARMTPELPAFRAALAALDPGRRFLSDLARRLALR